MLSLRSNVLHWTVFKQKLSICAMLGISIVSTDSDNQCTKLRIYTEFSNRNFKNHKNKVIFFNLVDLCSETLSIRHIKKFFFENPFMK